MHTFLCTWNPDLWEWPDNELRAEIAQTERGALVARRWSVGNRTHGIEAGDRVFLLRQHRDRGIVAAGEFTTEVFQDPHWDETGREANYARVAWDTVLAYDDRLPVEVLKAQVKGVPWDRLQASGVEVPKSAIPALEDLWETHLLQCGRLLPFSPNEVHRSETVVEGAVSRVLVNRYERDPRAREQCLAHWGRTCVVCGFDFGEVYGALGIDFIHVHHTREISTLGGRYKVDPVKDLRPVCPNCHAMLHAQRPALDVKELKKLLKTGTARTR